MLGAFRAFVGSLGLTLEAWSSWQLGAQVKVPPSASSQKCSISIY